MLNPFTALSTGTTQHIRRDTTKITTTHSHRFLWLSFSSFQIISLSNCEYCGAFKIFTHASHQASSIAILMFQTQQAPPRPNLYLYSPSNNTLIPCEEIIIPNPVMSPEGPVYSGPTNIYLAYPVQVAI